MAHICAMYLLAQFREPRAYPLLVNFFYADYEMVKDSTGDINCDGLYYNWGQSPGGRCSLLRLSSAGTKWSGKLGVNSEDSPRTFSNIVIG